MDQTTLYKLAEDELEQREHEPAKKKWLSHGLFSRVSRRHYYEARERFYSLVDIVRYRAKLLGLFFPDCAHKKSCHYQKIINLIEQEIENKYRENHDLKTQCIALLSCYESLIASKNCLSPYQGDLNRLWRTMARVRARILDLPLDLKMKWDQLYFCREEAYRLGVEDDPSIKAMLQELAELLNNEEPPNIGSGSSTPLKFNSELKALNERLNAIRTGKIHQQFSNIRVYFASFIALTIISIILICCNDLILDTKNNPHFEEKQLSIRMIISEKSSYIINLFRESNQEEQKISITRLLIIFENNMFLFIYFGGLLGGFFSIATKDRQKNTKQGDDVYLPAYVTTKPMIGALGAVILYILIRSDLMSQSILQSDLLSSLQYPGTVSFGFSFIAGFSERIVFPQFK